MSRIASPSTSARHSVVVMIATDDMLLHAVAKKLDTLAPNYRYGIDEDADNLTLIEDDIRLAHSIMPLDLAMMLIADEGVLMNDIANIRYCLDRFSGQLDYVSVFVVDAPVLH